MTGIDKELSEAVERKAYWEDRRVYLQQQESVMAQQCSATVHSVELESSTFSSSPEYITDEEAHPLPKVLKTTSQRHLPMVSPNLAAALDMTKVSKRGASHILKASAASLGNDNETLALSLESICRARCCHRSAVAEEIKNTLFPDAPLTVHWDEEIVLDLTGEQVDRLAILVSGDGVDKLLAVPKLSSGTGFRDRWVSPNTTPQNLHPMDEEEESQPLKAKKEKLLEDFSRYLLQA
ncbi:hypothetical protein Pcinc_014833 [Petrolisthes cinctipes]|uniref:Uncharacterized protein n=1 Tax=Petrolisthes cinctipes TaxID=88211 RepID=A0AAE1KSU4_PETCI|nr:hypothetical protein Pcinc_014833 [Petrolisthes cinctipes]